MAAASAAAKPPEEDRRPVRGYVDGCWDIMHSGHFNAIRQAKALCDQLVVGVHSDSVIAENKAVPVMRQAERYELLEHIKWIDEILPDVPYSPELATLEKARADFCVHGDDMPVNSQGVCAYQEMMDAGRLRIIKRMEGVSTTDLIGRLLTLSRHQHQPGKKGLPSQGVRVPASAVDFGTSLEACTSGGSSSRAALDRSLELLDGLATRHGLPSDEVGALREQLRLLAASSFSSSSSSSLPSTSSAAVAALAAAAAAAEGGGEGAGAGGPAAKRARVEKETEEEGLRTSVPVQLLTSTRRIAEFATARQPAQGDRVVYVSGSFDMFHVGHAQFLKDARALGTFLFVGIHDDLAVSGSKGAHYPVMTLNERVLNVCACKWVDEVIIGAPLNVTMDLIKTWNIHIVARGSGHMRAEALSGDDGYQVPRSLGIYREVESKWPHLCHDTVVKRIISDREAYLLRNKDRAAREDVYYARKDQCNSPLEV